MKNSLLEEIATAGLISGNTPSLADSLSAKLKEKNYFSLLLPANLGGTEIEYPAYVRLVQDIAVADGSTAWCVNQGSVLASIARFLPRSVAEKIWHQPSVTLANGSPVKSTSQMTAEGYWLTGNWVFSSGINHADWLIGIAKLSNGSRKVLWHLFPKHEATIAGDWQVSGLKATGSYPFSVTDLRIPTEHACSVRIRPEDPPIFQIPMSLLFAGGFAAVALGVSRAALDCTIQKLQEKIKRLDKQTMSQDSVTQNDVGRAEALWRAADAYLHSSVLSVWQNVNEQGSCTLDDKITLRLAATHAIHQARIVTDLAYDLCSTDSIFDNEDIQRRFQDMHVITQHLQGRPEIYSLAGRYKMGLTAESFLIT